MRSAPDGKCLQLDGPCQRLPPLPPPPLPVAHPAQLHTQAMDDLGSPSDWHLKGEGNANLVFAYAGSDPRLVRLMLAPGSHPVAALLAAVCAVWSFTLAAHTIAMFACRWAGCCGCANHGPRLHRSRRHLKMQFGHQCLVPWLPASLALLLPGTAPMMQMH